MILGAAALLGFGVGTVQSCGLAMAVRVTSDARLSVANATFYMLLDVGVALFELKDLINLTFCCQQATVITDFSDLTATSPYLAISSAPVIRWNASSVTNSGDARPAKMCIRDRPHRPAPAFPVSAVVRNRRYLQCAGSYPDFAGVHRHGAGSVSYTHLVSSISSCR